MADLHNVEGMLPVSLYESDRPICCLVNQDDVSSPDQAGDQVIGRRDVSAENLMGWNFLSEPGNMAEDCDATAGSQEDTFSGTESVPRCLYVKSTNSGVINSKLLPHLVLANSRQLRT